MADRAKSGLSSVSPFKNDTTAASVSLEGIGGTVYGPKQVSFSSVVLLSDDQSMNVVMSKEQFCLFRQELLNSACNLFTDFSPSFVVVF